MEEGGGVTGAAGCAEILPLLLTRESSFSNDHHDFDDDDDNDYHDDDDDEDENIWRSRDSPLAHESSFQKTIDPPHHNDDEDEGDDDYEDDDNDENGGKNQLWINLFGESNQLQ